MPRKPNYKFEKIERERQKAAKKAARLEAKREQAAEKKTVDGDGSDGASESSGEEE